MGFIYSAFIENSKEAREWLKSIGYKPCICAGDDPEDLIFTSHEWGKFHAYDKETSGDILAEREDIGGDEVDCRGNVELFKAIAAIRDDSDYLQWHTDGKDWCIYRETKHFDGTIVGGFEWNYFPKEFPDNKDLHKASKDELIQHFKK